MRNTKINFCNEIYYLWKNKGIIIIILKNYLMNERVRKNENVQHKYIYVCNVQVDLYCLKAIYAMEETKKNTFSLWQLCLYIHRNCQNAS